MSKSYDRLAQATEDFTATLYTLARIYDVGNQLLRSGAPVKPPLPVIEYGARMWADRHVIGLGWALLATVFVGLLLLVWPR